MQLDGVYQRPGGSAACRNAFFLGLEVVGVAAAPAVGEEQAALVRLEQAGLGGGRGVGFAGLGGGRGGGCDG